MPRTIGDGRGLVEKKVKVRVGGRVVTETRLYARVRYTDPETGKRRAKWKRVVNRTEGKTAVQDLAAEVRAHAVTAEAEEPKTFGDLANLYASTSLVPAEYRDGRKIRGRRSLAPALAEFRSLCAFFGAEPLDGGKWAGGVRLSSITYDSLGQLRDATLATPARVTKNNPEGRPRTIAATHRRLEILRNMLNVAVGKGWLASNPFKAGRALITPADEVRRKRLLTYEEEDRLLAECRSYTDVRPGKPPRNVFRAHLRAIVICALDTAMRLGEILKLRWRDLDAMTAGGCALTVQQMNTKTLEERGAPVPRRLRAEIERLRRETGGRPEALVFGITSNVSRGFAGACRDAGIKGLRFHDLRRTAATRLHREGMPIGEVSRILGHANITTTYRYIGVDAETVERAADFFDQIEDKKSEARKIRMRASVKGQAATH